MLLVEKLLPLMHHAQHVIVHDDLDDRNIRPRCGRQLIQIHAEAAVPGDIDHRLVRHRALDAEGRPQSVSHRAESAGGEELMRLLVMEVLRRPHLILSDLRDNACVVLRQLLNLLHDERTGQAILIVMERKFRRKLLTVADPFLMVRLLDQRVEPDQNLPHISDHTGIDFDVLVDLRRIDIELDDLRILCKQPRIADDTVREPGSDREQKIAAGDRQV